ncbi:hypothetical protein FISHEDRAFT_71177 [Fistulina hepatica ATCC 64428]|nr:hypothetical protein FISHEDRAFT_71177 [Fistulina hepatica ATCC 64428]
MHNEEVVGQSPYDQGCEQPTEPQQGPTSIEDAQHQGLSEFKDEDEQAQPSAQPLLLPEIAQSSSLDIDLSEFIGPSESTESAPEQATSKLQKRASNVLKLAEENEKLVAELKAMTDRLKAAERRRAELAKKQQKVMEQPSQ